MNKVLNFSNVVIVFCLFLSACNNKKEANRQEEVIPVKVTEVIVSRTADEKNYVGTVEEKTAISLSFLTMGTVEEVFVQEGETVQKGELLATLNTVTAQNANKLALSKLHQAQDAYNRLKKVYDNGSLADIKMVEVESGLEQAKSMVATTKKNLEDCRLTAPRNGIIANRKIEPGMNIMPNIEAFTLVSMEKVYVKISVPENEISKINEGQSASITVSALGDSVYRGKVVLKGVVADVISHTYDVKIEVANPKAKLMPGMVCWVKIQVSDNQNVSSSKIIVTNRCIHISSDNRHFVWLAYEGIAKRQFIEIGGFSNNGIVVVNGLCQGMKIISDGYLKISEGCKISIEN